MLGGLPSSQLSRGGLPAFEAADSVFRLYVLPETFGGSRFQLPNPQGENSPDLIRLRDSVGVAVWYCLRTVGRFAVTVNNSLPGTSAHARRILHMTN